MNFSGRNALWPRSNAIRSPRFTGNKEIVIVEIPIHQTGNLGCFGTERGTPPSRKITTTIRPRLVLA